MTERNKGLIIGAVILALGLVGGAVSYWVMFAGPVRMAGTTAAVQTTTTPPAGAPAVQTPTPTVPGTDPAPRSIAARAVVLVLDEETILAHAATVPRMIRLRENPRVFVLDFPTLDMQGEAMNRIAALVEKVGQPRDRLLDDAALARAITESGDTPATYYYGHNYRSTDLARFFMLAERDHVTLTMGEEWLRLQYETAGEMVQGPDGFALLAIPGVERRVDATMRRAILHHEIGHGHYFTRPAFAAHVHRVWREVFTEQERAAYRRFLQSEGYDPALEDVMINEAMAYTLFTPDRRFFSPAMVGLDDARVEALREALRNGF
ncbi:hypothetical protein [Plastoroseomonas hellenica]|uniref:hypothetical protein n=1 Tax=Plastoroseomonas hellenica TaxID=2687306 RepID=UPI001BA8DABD|nr:hypothetical protein [Plastoroseomonas hellenica]MBR0645934.1 hypothetical protein [Plastoroseomonas hellenica]